MFTLALIKKVFDWVREINPSQPITAGIYESTIPNWGDYENLPELEQFIINNSDIISYHDYGDKKGAAQKIKELKKYNRPLLCTEYLAREYSNTFEELLPLFKQNRIGVFNWGLVSGKSNTIYPWKSWDSTYTGPPKIWHHDLFYPNGEPFSVDEIEFIKNMISSAND